MSSAAIDLLADPTAGDSGIDMSAGEKRFLIHGVSWKDYCVLREALDIPGLRMAFDSGVLELMSPSPLHEVYKKSIARLIETWSLEVDVSLNGYGSATFRREAKEKGAEPDECWCLGGPLDEYPDIVLEVVLTSGGLNKLKIYASFGVQEVWFWLDHRFRFFALRGEEYVEVPTSELIPQLPVAQITNYAERHDQHEALKEFRAEILSSL